MLQGEAPVAQIGRTNNISLRGWAREIYLFSSSKEIRMNNFRLRQACDGDANNAWQMKIEEISVLRWQYCHSICKFQVVLERERKMSDDVETSTSHMHRWTRDSQIVSTQRLQEINKKAPDKSSRHFSPPSVRLRVHREKSFPWQSFKPMNNFPSQRDSRGLERQGISWPKREAIALLSNQQTIGSRIKPKPPPPDCYLQFARLLSFMKVLCRFMQQIRGAWGCEVTWWGIRTTTQIKKFSLLFCYNPRTLRKKI